MVRAEVVLPGSDKGWYSQKASTLMIMRLMDYSYSKLTIQTLIYKNSSALFSSTFLVIDFYFEV